MKSLQKVALNIVKLIIFKIPKNKNIWITGSVEKWFDGKQQPCFIDNSKYLYIYLVEKTKKEVYWLTEEKEVYEEFKRKKLPVLYKYSLIGLWKSIRGKIYFSHYGGSQITNLLDYGAIQLNMWHGTPLKKIRYDVVPPVIQVKSKVRRVFDKIIKIKKEEYVSSTSHFLSEKILKKAFRVDGNHLLNFGYPRTDIFGKSKNEIIEFCKKYSEELLPILKQIQGYKKIIIYMPTWRDENPNYLNDSDLNLKSLNKVLKKNNYLLLLKLHPLTDIKLEKFSNICVLENNVDIYPILPFTDILLTDYSSIYFDYLLLDKEIIFLPFDKEEYISSRELYFNYDEVTPGIKIKSFLELEKLLDNLDKLNFKEQRNKIKDLFVENYKFNASKKIIDYIDERY